jgi:hypothetical protein
MPYYPVPVKVNIFNVYRHYPFPAFLPKIIIFILIRNNIVDQLQDLTDNLQYMTYEMFSYAIKLSVEAINCYMSKIVFK